MLWKLILGIAVLVAIFTLIALVSPPLANDIVNLITGGGK